MSILRNSVSMLTSWLPSLCQSRKCATDVTCSPASKDVNSAPFLLLARLGFSFLKRTDQILGSESLELGDTQSNGFYDVGIAACSLRDVQSFSKNMCLVIAQFVEQGGIVSFNSK